MEKRSRRRTRDLVTQPASQGLSENEIGCARISMMAKSMNALFTGRIQKRKTNPLASETSAGHAVLLLSLFPPLAAVLASVFLRERLTVLRAVAILIGVVGAVILTLSKSGAGSSLAGDAMIGGLILTWAFLTLGIRKLDTTYPALFVVGVFGTIGCLLLTGIGLVAGRIDAIFIPLNHFDAATIIWFDFWMVLPAQTRLSRLAAGRA